MSRTSKKPGSEMRVPGKPGLEVQVPGPGRQCSKSPGKPGRKPANKKLAAPRRRRRKLPPGRGAERLRSSVNVILNDESDLIARALVDKTIAGNITSARLLVELSGAKHPPTGDDNDDYDGPRLSDILFPNGLPAPIEPTDPECQLPGDPPRRIPLPPQLLLHQFHRPILQ